MADRYAYNPFTGDLDNVGPIFMLNGSLYFNYGGNRYKITSVLDNPAASFFLLEDGSSNILLEDGSSKLLLEV